MILNDKYYTACDLAHKLSPPFFTDIVHDSFVDWYDKTKKNLFDEEEGVVLRAVKKMYHKKYGHQPKTLRYTERMKQVLVTPEDELIEREMGLLFVSYEEISQRVEDYVQFHTMYPKIHSN